MRLAAISSVVALLACGRVLPTASDDLAADIDGGTGVGEDSVTSSLLDAGGHDSDSASDAGPTKKDATASPYVFVPLVSAPVFSDDFARTDGLPGNGWSLKTAGAFAIVSGALQQTSGGPYADRVVFRPAAETFADVEVSATFALGDCCGWAGILTRVQPESDTPGTLVAYRLALNSAYVEVHTMRQNAQAIDLRLPFAISLVIGERYRATVRVTGRDPVVVEARVSRLDGSILAEGRGEDGSSYRITGPGRVGMNGGAVAGTTFDDVEVRVP